MVKKAVTISCFNAYEMRFKHINKYLKDVGYDVLYVTSDFNHSEKKYYKTDYENCVQIHVPGYLKNISVKRLFSHYVFSKKLYSVLMKEKPDVVYCLYPPNSAVKTVAKASKKLKAKLVFDCYDRWPESFPISSKYRLLKPFLNIWKNLRDKYIQSADLLIAECNAASVFFEKIYNITCRALYPFYSTSHKLNYSPDEDSLSFCYLGHINSILNRELAVYFLIKLAEHKRTALHIIGRGENLEEFASKLRAGNVEVIEHGVVFDVEEKRQIMSLCDFGLNIPKEEIHVGLALKTIDYLSFGLPYINSTTESDNFSIVKDYGVGFNITEKSVNDICNEIVKMSCKERLEMHERSEMIYKKLFLNQNFKEILSGII